MLKVFYVVSLLLILEDLLYVKIVPLLVLQHASSPFMLAKLQYDTCCH